MCGILVEIFDHNYLLVVVAVHPLAVDADIWVFIIESSADLPGFPGLATVRWAVKP